MPSVPLVKFDIVVGTVVAVAVGDVVGVGVGVGVGGEVAGAVAGAVVVLVSWLALLVLVGPLVVLASIEVEAVAVVLKLAGGSIAGDVDDTIDGMSVLLGVTVTVRVLSTAATEEGAPGLRPVLL